MPAVPPPVAAQAPVVWSARPTEAEVRDASAYHARANDRAGTVRMRCVVRLDGGLEACGADRSADADLAHVPALMTLIPRFRVDMKAGVPPTTALVEVAFPKLVDADPRRLKAPDKTALERANTQDRRGVVGLRCMVGVDGALAECAPDPRRDAEPALLAAALAVVGQYRYAPARLNGQAVAAPRLVEIAFESRGDTPPGWLHKPDISQLLAVWPAVAASKGLGGRAVVTCRVSPAGVLARCEVDDETPQGLGFGGAALALTPTFTMKPATHAGAPVESEVTIPIVFANAGGGTLQGARVRVLPWMVWAASPNREDVRRVYPAAAAARRVEGNVAFQCGLKETGALTGCQVAQQFPGGEGFDGAARRLLPLFKADTTVLEAKDLPGLRVQVSVRFSQHALDPAAAYQITQADWVQGPTPEIVRAAYPPAAVAAQRSAGRATIDCTVQADGALGACRAVSADPAGMDFEGAAVRVGQSLKLNLWTREGEPAAGARIVLPLRMVNGGGAGQG